MDLSKLTIGTEIQIKRSNGRVHKASISDVDKERQFVSVEWYESGETKGKEVDFEQVYSLNIGLFAGPTLRSSSRKTIATPGSKFKPYQLRSVENVVSSNIPIQRRELLPKAVAAVPPRARHNFKLAFPPPHTSPEDPELSKPREQEVLKQEVPKQEVPKQEVPKQEVPKQEVPKQAVSKEKPPVSKSRKSNCVKEVERLKKNRDERRARQAAIAKEECDTSHPQWEFLQKIREFRAKLQLKPLVGNEQIVHKRICVCVRKRPLNKKEMTKREVDVITIPDKSGIMVHEPKMKVDLTKYLDNQNFCFDYSFDEGVDNEVVYRFTAQPLVQTIFDRGMATCFAYGQTGSGKTHTMGGEFSGKEQDATRGIYAMAAADVFRLHSLPENESKDLTIHASFFEIYSGKVFDLLNNKAKLRILEDAKQQVQIVGLYEDSITCVEDVLELIQLGNACRTSGTTSANQHSSRSHAVFQIIVRKRASRKLFGKFSLIDLAGNERGADTANSDRLTRMEGAEINTSLLALKECIRALGRKGAHLPFRGSKLTQVLKDSFVGDNSRTCMIAMISPGFSSCEHTLNTLRYANRVKEIRSTPGGGGGGMASKQPEVLPSQQEVAKEPSSPVHSDLQYLHLSLQTEEGINLNNSSELLTFHEAISNLVESEEQLVEEHKDIIQEDWQLLEEEQKLLEYVDDVDHDIEEYVRRLEGIVSQKVERLSKFKERIQDLRQRLEEEETASKGVRRLPPVL